MSTSSTQLLNILEETAGKLKKAQVNLKKCPKARLTRGYLQARLQCIEEYWQSFKITHEELVKCTTKDQRADLEYFANEDYYFTEDLFLCLQGDLKDLVFTLSSSGEVSSNLPTVNQTQVKLPTIQLPEFSGNYEDWPTYHDLFISLVHDNKSLSLVQKLQYLKSSITGEAEALLKHIKVTENNYEQAWNILKNRFGNKRVIVNTLFKRLTGQKAIKTPTANQIKSLLDTTAECMNSLQNQDLTVDNWDPLIIYLVVQKLDPETHKDWEEHTYTQEFDKLPTLKEFYIFLESKFRTLELVTPGSSSAVSREKTIKDKLCHVSANTPVKTCTMCKEEHALCHCKEFIKLQPMERTEFVRKNSLCYNCLAPGHSAWKCRIPVFCRRCNGRHHSLLHKEKGNKQSDNSQTPQLHIEGKESNKGDVAIASHFVTKKSTALLATALVYVKGNNGLMTVLRALIDQGSHESFISESAVQRLKIKRKATKGTITTVGGKQTDINQSVEFDLLSRCEDDFKVTLNAYVIPKNLTSNLPPRHFTHKTADWPHLQGLTLADPSYNQPGRVDLLLGVQVYDIILKSGLVKGPLGSPSAQDTRLGWILYGKVEENTSSEDITVMHQHIDMENMLKAFWEVEDDSEKKLTKDEETCEKIYRETYKRNDEGRFVVKLPFKTEKPKSCEGKTRDIALRRYMQLEKRFENDTNLRTEYTKVMKEYIDLKHMEIVPKTEIDNSAVYLPHHPVLKETSETTKVRVVFDASSKGCNSISLNDEMLIGPQLQEDMRYLVMRWRMKPICFVADVEKMYRQVLVTKEDADYQRILWRHHSTETIKDYRLLRVTFGTASAPYLAVKTLQQLAENECRDNPIAAETIKNDFFMDDLMSGQDTIEQAIEVAKDINHVLQGGGFKLQKWASNSSKFLEQFEAEHHSKQVKIDMKLHGTVRTLGLSWNMGDDTIHYHLDYALMTGVVTKRKILADIHRLFDPLGWLAPAIVPAKILIQNLWLKQSAWDDEVDPETEKEWISIRKSLSHLKVVKLQRWLQSTSDSMRNASVHGFCDASNKAYGAVAYLRVLGEDNQYKTTIIAAKSRVVPVKPMSLPRIELCGAVLLSKLLKQISEAMRIPANQIFSWTDSTIVLSWLQGDPTRWQTFVRNRVVTIIDNIGYKWFHVLSKENPADVVSRGMLLSDLKNCRLWWEGPEWLKENKILFTSISTPTDLERRKGINVNVVTEQPSVEEKNWSTHFEACDTLKELVQSVTYCRQFLNLKRNIQISLNTEELERSLHKCIQITQRECFEEEIKDLKEKGTVKNRSVLKSLNPYLDQNHILRVGGRIRHANIDKDRKHPIILDNKSRLTKLIVADAHKATLHGSVQLMYNYIRSKYWIVRQKSLVKAEVHKCLICAKQRAEIRNQFMGDLPKERVTPARAFLHCGVDFAGPYNILMSKGRGAKTNKGYISLFICMATKAIHLELVGDLTSEAFIGAFRRFVSRRGRCNHMWSDQGRNFVGANKELVEAWNAAKLEFQGEIIDILAKDGTQWHFIPGYSPNFGGLWEAGIKSTKYHIKRVLNSHITFEEMTTLLCQIEACLNSRPLCPIDDSDKDDLEVLTPGHFLIGEAPITVPSPSLKDVPVSKLSRWQHTQKLLNDFWQRWQHEYLARLQQRPKWLKTVPNLEIGQIVLVKTDNAVPGKWPLGRIVDKHPGQDAVTRVYSVKTGNHVVKRSIGKLCLLPVDTNV